MKDFEWRPITELRTVEEDISEFCYDKEYIVANKWYRKKIPHCTDSSSGQVNFSEPLEVKEEGGEVFYCEKDSNAYGKAPETFETQYGTFINHDNGEFASWLGKEGYDGLSEEEREEHHCFGRDDYYIGGNFCDMFDCGEYSYAISNQMHMGLGGFKIVKIGRNLEATNLYDTDDAEGWLCLDYKGRFQNERGTVLIVSGFEKGKRGTDGQGSHRDRTILFQIDRNGECNISREWEIEILESNSTAVAGDFAYFGRNRMVTRLNLTSGELSYLTNKNEEELAALKPEIF